MASNTSYESSWADQWDPESLYSYDNSKSTTGGGAASKFTAVGEKTKAAATTGVRKVKAGASAGIHWIREKCHG